MSRSKQSKSSLFHTLIVIFITYFIILFIIIGTVTFIRDRYRDFDYQPFVSTETADELHNPYRGFYTLYGFILSNEANDLQKLLDRIPQDNVNNLALVEINLIRFAQSDISYRGLQQLDAILAKWAESGSQIILRFLYDWDGKNMDTEPEDINQILTHMEQVAPIVNTYADHIYILQGIFVGNYGEMNNSSYLGEEDIKLLVNKLFTLTDSSIFLSVRTPAQWRICTDLYIPLVSTSYFPSFNGTLISRLGLYNDGMLGSVTDLGTYGYTSFYDAPSFSYKGTREEELDFQHNLCDYVPNGGEVVIDNSYNDLDNAIRDLKTMHVSYLNSSYDSAVLNKWKNTTYHSTDCFNGIDGYTYIQEHLGYRYVLRSSNIEYNTWFDDNAVLSCTLENVGFAPCLRNLTVSFLLEDAESLAIIEIPLEEDFRYLSSDAVLRLTTELPIRDYTSGTYRVYLKITDPVSNIQIQIATDLEQSELGYLLGEFTLSTLR